MEKYEIRPLLEGTMAKQSLSLLQVLETEIKSLYATFGKHHTMTAEAIGTDVKFIAKKLNEAIKLDAKYSSLREKEIPYVFRQGVQGAFGEKYKTLSLSLVYAWLSEYMSSQERRSALSEWVALHSQDLPDDNGAHVGRKLTEKEMWDWVERNYESYCQAIAMKAKPIVPTMLQQSKVPWPGQDVSGLLTKFLRERGYMKQEEKFFEFLDRTIQNEGIFVKVA